MARISWRRLDPRVQRGVGAGVAVGLVLCLAVAASGGPNGEQADDGDPSFPSVPLPDDVAAGDDATTASATTSTTGVPIAVEADQERCGAERDQLLGWMIEAWDAGFRGRPPVGVSAPALWIEQPSFVDQRAVPARPEWADELRALLDDPEQETTTTTAPPPTDVASEGPPTSPWELPGHVVTFADGTRVGPASGFDDSIWVEAPGRDRFRIFSTSGSIARAMADIDGRLLLVVTSEYGSHQTYGSYERPDSTEPWDAVVPRLALADDGFDRPEVLRPLDHGCDLERTPEVAIDPEAGGATMLASVFVVDPHDPEEGTSLVVAGASRHARVAHDWTSTGRGAVGAFLDPADATDVIDVVAPGATGLVRTRLTPQGWTPFTQALASAPVLTTHDGRTRLLGVHVDDRGAAQLAERASLSVEAPSLRVYDADQQLSMVTSRISRRDDWTFATVDPVTLSPVFTMQRPLVERHLHRAVLLGDRAGAMVVSPWGRPPEYPGMGTDRRMVATDPASRLILDLARRRADGSVVRSRFVGPGGHDVLAVPLFQLRPADEVFGAAVGDDLVVVCHDGRLDSSRVDAAITHVGRSTDPDLEPLETGPTYSWVWIEGEELHTISDAGWLVSDVGTFADISWTPFTSSVGTWGTNSGVEPAIRGGCDGTPAPPRRPPSTTTTLLPAS